jgi:hypothetical protein
MALEQNFRGAGQKSDKHLNSRVGNSLEFFEL